MFGHVNFGGDHPVFPRKFAAYLIVHGEGHVAHKGRNQIDKVLAIHHIIKFRHTMGSESLRVGVGRICGTDDRGAGELSDGHMIGVAVVAVRRKGHHHLRFYFADVRHDLRDRLFMRRLIHIPINVIKEVQTLHPQFADGVLQFHAADLAESFQTWKLLLGTEPASLSARSADEVCIHSFGRILRQRGAHPH